MQLSVITPQKKIVEGATVTELFAPGVEGLLDILPDHANFVTELTTGVVKWKTTDGKWDAASVSYGWLEVNAGNVIVLADVAELSTNVDKVRAQKAETQARKKIEAGGLDDSDFRKQELKLQRAMSRLTAGE